LKFFSSKQEAFEAKPLLESFQTRGIDGIQMEENLIGCVSALFGDLKL
jgi:hypothetical protein